MSSRKSVVCHAESGAAIREGIEVIVVVGLAPARMEGRGKRLIGQVNLWPNKQFKPVLAAVVHKQRDE